MKTKLNKPKKPKTAYLTKRILVSVARAAIRKASDSAMDIMGYVVKAENGWVIREDKDGTKTRLEKISKGKKPSKIVLD